MDNASKGLLNGQFNFKSLPGDKTKVICIYCRAEFVYHQNTSHRFHLQAKPTVDAGNTSKVTSSNGEHLRQAKLEGCARRRPVDKQQANTRNSQVDSYSLQASPQCGGRRLEG